MHYPETCVDVPEIRVTCLDRLAWSPLLVISSLYIVTLCLLTLLCCTICFPSLLHRLKIKSTKDK
ncbi:MAG: hypothetical protein KVP17_002636 [Porospora cf. gigantea B]|uniref:uncharacterized protein n=1 Tax=Porospora cf. gigantea A TaxID=2853593 RepID=UPI00355A4C9A|nr:MAG: hypothetical protein KVP18_001159 [Porospora cf. gigantea A]KAH0485979.1 MAG: hypothetical protein KVP17_002636 [Porospora cf. gigantea B]